MNKTSERRLALLAAFGCALAYWLAGRVLAAACAALPLSAAGQSFALHCVAAPLAEELAFRGGVLGLVLGAVRQRTGRVWPGWVLHTLNNLLVFAAG